MALYDALIAKWATLTPGTTEEKLATINALTVSGPRVDVDISSVVGVLILSGAYLKVSAFATTQPTSDATHDTALASAKILASMMTIPNAPRLQTSISANYDKIKGMVDAILAQEAVAPGTTGISQEVHDELLALAETSVPWATAPIALGGGGLTGPISENDLIAAGGLS